MNLANVLAFKIPRKPHVYTERDAILYALGVGLGQDPLDAGQLPYVYEQQLRALPMFSLVLAHPGFWINDPGLELNWANALHTEQYLTVLKPLKPSGRVAGDYRISGIADRGAERGATLYIEKILTDLDSGEVVARLTSGLLCRKDGGCGNHGEVPEQLSATPDSAPDATIEWHIDSNAALVYRLSGDVNPLHVDPAVAQRAGFERPILHGLCTMGIASQIVLRHAEALGNTHLSELGCRFMKPVYPGDTLLIDIWNGDALRFQARDAASGAVVLARGLARFV
ncbi:MAG: MaoC/PaaZ C-terminal domain-containing protein [Pseudomonadota bacterium]